MNQHRAFMPQDGNSGRLAKILNLFKEIKMCFPEKKLALITGAGAGIGEPTAQALVEAETKVIVTDYNLDSAQRVANDIASKNKTA
jgi:MinD-like ATPase involved in chromosome partitioning or flagellar assembly